MTGWSGGCGGEFGVSRCREWGREGWRRLVLPFLKNGHGGSSGEEKVIETGGFESAEVGIKSHKTETGADGDGGEVGVHPDLGRCRWDGG